MIRYFVLVALLFQPGFAFAFERDCSFLNGAEPVRLRLQWDPVRGKGSGELLIGSKIAPVRIEMVQSIWWGLGEDVLYTLVEFSLADGTRGELRDFPGGTEPDSITLPRAGDAFQISETDACDRS